MASSAPRNGPTQYYEIGATCVVSIAFFISRVNACGGKCGLRGLLSRFPFRFFPRAIARRKNQIARNSYEVNRECQWEGVRNECPTYDPVRTIRKSLHRRWSKSTSSVHSSACVWHSESKIWLANAANPGTAPGIGKADLQMASKECQAYADLY